MMIGLDNLLPKVPKVEAGPHEALHVNDEGVNPSASSHAQKCF